MFGVIGHFSLSFHGANRQNIRPAANAASASAHFMGIDYRRLQVAVSNGLLDRAHIATVRQKVRLALLAGGCQLIHAPVGSVPEAGPYLCKREKAP